nr:2TM domain-containing protein [Rhodoferax sp.]
MADKPAPHTPPLSAEEIDRIASKRAGSKLGWFFHAAAFTGVNLVVFSMSKYGFGDRSWSIIPFLGWGVGLALHGVSVWVLGAGGGLRERMVQKERERLLRAQDRRDGP